MVECMLQEKSSLISYCYTAQISQGVGCRRGGWERNDPPEKPSTSAGH